MVFTLKSAEFRRERQASWFQLEALLDRIDADGIRSLDGQEMRRLYALYRAASSSYNVAKSVSLDRNLDRYLENLVRRGYVAVYGTRFGARRGIGMFIRQDFPRAVRAIRWQLLTITLVFFAGTLCGFALTAHDSERFYSFVDPSYAAGRDPSATTAQLREALYSTEQPADEELAQFAAFLLNNNATIGLLSFALGFLAAIPVFLLIFQNALLLGAFWALHYGRDLGADFVGFVMPHGVTEIGALLLCGAAGLAIGQALVFPGRMTRLDNLAMRGRATAPVVIGAVGMLFIAALIEGFFRQLVTDIEVRYTVIFVTTLVWASYFTLAGRTAHRSRSEVPDP